MAPDLEDLQMIRTATTPVLPPRVVPRLQNGDHLTREEFERRYDADPDLKKAELIEGVVYMASPVSYSNHGKPHFNIIGWLARYITATPGIGGGDNSSLRIDRKNMPQPDAILLLRPEYGGQTGIDDDGYVTGVPELVVEIAASSVSYDLHVKLKLYQSQGVREYIVWRVEDKAIDWFASRKGSMETLVIRDGIYKSKVFPGLWLDPQALIAEDHANVASVAQAGLDSPEHQKFVEKLQKKRG
jgi:Uma2 family endonuclease